MRLAGGNTLAWIVTVLIVLALVGLVLGLEACSLACKAWIVGKVWGSQGVLN